MLLSRAAPVCRLAAAPQRAGVCGQLAPLPRMAPAQRRGVAASAAAAAGGADDVTGDMLAPSAANTPWARALGTAAAVAATAASTTVMPAQGAHFVHLLCWGVMLGANVWNSFFVGLTMFKNMPRQMFGRVQSKLFPAFFALTTGANLVLLGGLWLGGLAAAPPNAVATLGGCALASAANWLVIEPKTTAVMFERYMIENKAAKGPDDEAAIKALYKRFGALHGASSVLNLGVLAATVAYGWTLAGRLAL
ncbi:Tmem205 [Scenedesmus sp. PABB004]|nr:Tmem205 [Scenedesmus sp. PABB004]